MKRNLLFWRVFHSFGHDVSMSRPLTRQDLIRFQKMRRLAHLMDEAVRIPGTRWRFGWDSVLGLIPGVGDLVTGLVSLHLIRQANRLGVPAPLISRMLLNLVMDVAGGAVPLAGDLMDVAWKANKRNMLLVEGWLGERVQSERSKVIDV